MDTDRVIRAQKGDTGAFTDLAAEIGDRYLAIAHKILRDLSLAEDATQQALLRMWQDLPQLREPDRFEAWSYRVLVNACYREARKQRRWVPNLRVVEIDPVAVSGLESVADRDELESGFRQLSMDHRTVVVLYHLLDKPIDEIAEILGVPYGTVQSRLHYAMRSLRASLEAHARTVPQELVS